MSETINLKDIEKNAKRLMENKDYQEALQNWNYIVK